MTFLDRASDQVTIFRDITAGNVGEKGFDVLILMILDRFLKLPV